MKTCLDCGSEMRTIDRYTMGVDFGQGVQAKSTSDIFVEQFQCPKCRAMCSTMNGEITMWRHKPVPNNGSLFVSKWVKV